MIEKIKVFYHQNTPSIFMIVGLFFMISFSTFIVNHSYRHDVHIKSEPKENFIHWIFNGFYEKIQRLALLEKENQILKKKISNLTFQLAHQNFESDTKEANRLTQVAKSHLQKESNTTVGRTLETIHYKAPPDLLPSQAHMLAIAYFKKNEFEKTAVLLSSLVHSEQTEVYKTSKNYLFLGIVWYYLDNYHLADEYFEKIFNHPEKDKKMISSALLWRALIAKKQQDNSRVHQLLERLIEFNPLSDEVKLINQR